MRYQISKVRHEIRKAEQKQSEYSSKSRLRVTNDVEVSTPYSTNGSSSQSSNKCYNINLPTINNINIILSYHHATNCGSSSRATTNEKDAANLQADYRERGGWEEGEERGREGGGGGEGRGAGGVHTS